jgi:hypothetical protein
MGLPTRADARAQGEADEAEGVRVANRTCKGFFCKTVRSRGCWLRGGIDRGLDANHQIQFWIWGISHREDPEPMRLTAGARDASVAKHPRTRARCSTEDVRAERRSPRGDEDTRCRGGAFPDAKKGASEAPCRRGPREGGAMVGEPPEGRRWRASAGKDVGHRRGVAKRKRDRGRGCPGGVQRYPERDGVVGSAGGRRGWPESAKNCGGQPTESASLATTRGAQARFLRGGEPGQRGGALGALGLERGGRNRRGVGELLTVTVGFLPLSFACRER